MKRGLQATITKYSLLSLLILSGFGLLSACSSDGNKINAPVIANIQLENTLLDVSIVADSLNVPWDIQFINDRKIIYTEIAGKIGILDLATGKKKHIYTVKDVFHKRTLGLLGMTVSPNLREHPYIFITYTIQNATGIFSRLERLTLKGDNLSDPLVLHTIPGSTGHNGSRLAFSNDGKLLWATGDAHSKTFAQDSTSLNGKILRMNIDGSVPQDNPITGSMVYAWGFRNIQGLTVADDGNIYTSEHGDAIEDEVNRIKPLQNYGWPEIEGYHDIPSEMEIASNNQRTEPIRSWTPVIAPAGLKYYNSKAIPEWKNSLLLVSLKNQSLRSIKLSDDGRSVIEEWMYLEKYFGRLRAVTVSPSGDVYLATSNRDWNPQPGFPKEKDDLIIKLSPAKKASFTPLKGVNSLKSQVVELDGASLYNAYCASCHKENGEGIEGIFPPLSQTETVNGAPKKLIDITLNGLSGEITVNGKTYNQEMPAFRTLKDTEIAKILTFIRSNFGNNGSTISTEDITKQRK